MHSRKIDENTIPMIPNTFWQQPQHVVTNPNVISKANSTKDVKVMTKCISPVVDSFPAVDGMKICFITFNATMDILLK